jgi:predicted transposase YbfD/YdcC
VFARLNPTAFQQAFVAWVDAIRFKLPGDVIALDGKTERRTHDRAIDLSPLHIVSAWSTANRLVLGQVRTADKSNEITAIPLLLELLDVQDCIITIDALGCQVAIAEQIVAQEAEYVLACKGNQGHLARDVERLFADLLEQDHEQAGLDYCATIHEAHGRREVREYWSTDQLERISTRARWPQLRSVARVRSERTIAGVTSVETRQYISSLPRGQNVSPMPSATIGGSRTKSTGYWMWSSQQMTVAHGLGIRHIIWRLFDIWCSISYGKKRRLRPVCARNGCARAGTTPI